MAPRAPYALPLDARAASARQRPPSVDERLVAPEHRVEVIGGELRVAEPSDEPHGTAVFDLAALLHAHARRGFRGAVDMLMRAHRYSDFAPDASLFPEERDPVTGGRKLEDLVFEIIDAQPLSKVTGKARLLVARGVRKVFCVDLPRRRVLRWSRRRDDWVALGPEGAIEDKTCLVRPLPVNALLDAAQVDEATSAGLLAKGTQTLRRALEEKKQEGVKLGLDEGLKLGIDQGKKLGLDEGKRLGLDEGKRQEVMRLFERKLGRPLTEAERAMLAVRLRTLGPGAVGDVVLDLTAGELTGWLLAPR